MKKILSLVLVVVLVLGMMPVFAAGETGAEKLYQHGFIAGDNGDLMVNKALTRAEMAVLMAELNGVKTEAANYAAPANFSDVAAGKWYTPYVAYGQQQGWFAGYPDGTFKPEASMTGQEFAAVLMNALKYDFTWNTVVADAAAIGVSVTEAGFNRGAAFEAMWAAVNKPVKGEEVALGVKLGRLEKAEVVTPGGPLAVESIKASSAKSFTVKFNKAVTEADKITFAVTRTGTAVTVTTAWNEAKTEATLATASNLAEATFEVKVLADEKEVAKETIAITAQKVAKIEYTSTTVAVRLTAPNNGFVTYKAYDQYGNDITTSYLANNMTFTTGAGTATGKNGLITIVPGATPLLQFQNISVIAYDTTSNVSATVTLPTSSAVGTLKSFTLGSVEKVNLVENDVTSTFYLPYTAVDMSGNETKDYDLIVGGLIDADTATAGVIDLTVSLPSNVTAKIVRDPADNNKAAVEVKVKTSATALAMDMPVSITAMSYAGGTSTVQTTIVKAKTVNTITLFAPANTVAVGETPTIEFEAYDQFGNKVTKYSDINGKVTFTGLTLSEKTDGSGKLTVSAPLVKGVTTLSAVVSNSGKMSMITLNVQDAAKPAKIVLNSGEFVNAMEVNATQNLVVGEGEGIEVYDQYDRKMEDADVTTAFGGGAAYRIDITNTASAKVAIGTATLNNIGTSVLTAAATEGSDTISVTLRDVVNATNLSTVQISFSVIKTTDIVDYTINEVTSPIYTSIGRTAGAANAARAVDTRYDAEYKVYGKTSSGAKVLLAGTPVNNAYVSNTEDFVVTTSNGAYDVTRVNAIRPIDPAKTTAETKVTVNLLHNNKLTALTTNLTSSTAAPVAKSIAVSSASNDMDSATQAETHGLYLVDYVASTGAAAPAASFRFRITDQYGSRAMAFTAFHVAKATNAAGATIATNGITISAEGQVTVTGAHAAGNSYWISASTNNGLVKTVKLTITD